MKKISKILMLNIAVLSLFSSSVLAAESILENNNSKNIEIYDNIKDKIFSPKENIVLRGVSVPSKEIIIFLDDKVGLTESDKNGNWVINLGTASKGNHNFQMITDISDDSRSTTTFHIVVGESNNSLFGNLTAAISRILSFNQPEKIKLYPRVR